LEELRDGSVSRAVAMYSRRDKIRTAPDSGDTITAAVEAWHRDIQEVEQPGDVLLIGDRNTTVRQLNQLARACLVREGRLTGPAVLGCDRTFQKGDRVVCLKNRSRVGVLNGDLGGVTAVDTEQGTITVHLDRTGRPVTIPSWYLDEGNLDWGYALTGHKAQGATAGRVHTVAGGSVDREWIYVAMSRGRDANTIYLTDARIDDEKCTHVAHQRSGRLPALMAALGRSAAQPAAIDSGRGPELLTDEQLRLRLEEVECGLGAGEQGIPAPAADGGGLVGEYLALRREANDRFRDRLAEVAFAPPPWIVDTLGERPSGADQRAVWDDVVSCALRYRREHGVPDEVRELLGPAPSTRDLDRWMAWPSTRRRVELLLGSLEASRRPHTPVRVRTTG